MSLAIRVENVSKSYASEITSVKDLLLGVAGKRTKLETRQVLKDVSFDVEIGESLAVLGSNGAGKSTLLKLVASIVRPTSGRVFTRGRVVPLLELGAGFHPDLTGRENIVLNATLLGMRKSEIMGRSPAIIEFAELEQAIDKPVRNYSTGMTARLGFAIAIHSEPDVLLLDEVLSVGDAQFQEKSLAAMHEIRKAGVTVLFVTHSTKNAIDFCDSGLVLNNGGVVFQGSAQKSVKVYTKPAAAGGY